MLKRLLQDEEGATAIEYALIAVLISISAIIAFTTMGLDLADIFTKISTALRSHF